MNFDLKYMHWKNQDARIQKMLSFPYVDKQISGLKTFCGEYALDPIILRKYKEKLPWLTITINQKLSEETMREFEDYIAWQVVPNNQIVSEQFIKEYKDKMMCMRFWHIIPKYQKLSEDFIEEFKNELDWEKVSTYQDFTDAFADKYIDRIDWMKYFGYHSSNSIDSVSEGFIKKHLKDKFRDVNIIKEILWAFPVSDILRAEMTALREQLFREDNVNWGNWGVM